MKLYYAPPSPYSLKVKVTLEEKGLTNKVTYKIINPYLSEPELVFANPLSKIPCLVTEDGVGIYDSPIICEYIDSLNDTPKLIPASGEERWKVLRGQALADGIMDAAFLVVSDRRRQDAEPSQIWITRQLAAIVRACDAVEHDVAGFDKNNITLDQLALASALSYVSFRLSDDIDWQAEHPQLTAWFNKITTRKSFKNNTLENLPV
jgi:glutathione S-transferase